MRAKLLPDLSIITEGGLPAFQADAWTVQFAPRNVPAAIMSRIHAAYANGMANPDAITRIEQLGAVPPGEVQC